MGSRSAGTARRRARLAPIFAALAVIAVPALVVIAAPALASIVPSTAPPPPGPAADTPPAAPPAVASPAAPPAAPSNPAQPLSTPILATPSNPPPVAAPAQAVAPVPAPPASDAPPPGWTAAPDDAAPPPASATATPAPAPPAPAAAAPAAPAPAAPVIAGPPVLLDQPEVPDTGRLAAAGRSVVLSGVTGLGGQFATDLRGAIAADGGHVSCQQQPDGDYRCDLPDGTDIAALALRNGAAQTRPDAPDHYLELENLAREERRGIWASLPPPPTRLEHPAVVDTATLTAGGATYKLDGLIGLGGEYATNLQGYIAANGDVLTCSPQGGSGGDAGEFVCLMPDQTDIAKLALVNGAARVAPDAPDAYRAEQADALAHHRGFWLHPPAEALATASAPPVATSYALVAGDDGDDGIRYVGGAPTAVIGGETVFLVFAGAVGWGYWDHAHRWHGAPERYGRHMERFHPGGNGLRGYAGPHGFGAARVAAARPGMGPGMGPRMGPGGAGPAFRGGPAPGRAGFGTAGVGHPPPRFAGAPGGGFVRPPQMHGAPSFRGAAAMHAPPAMHGAPAFRGGPAFSGPAFGGPAFRAAPPSRPAFHQAPAFHPSPGHAPPPHHR